MFGKSELKIGVILTYINLFATNIISIFYTPYILRTLGQAEYGVYMLVWNVVNYLTVLDLGFSNAIIRYASKYRAKAEKEEESALYGMFLIIYLVIGIISICVCLIMKKYFGNVAQGLTDDEVRVAATLVMIGSINISLSFPLSVFRAIVTVSEKFLFIKIVDLLRTLITPVITFCVLSTGKGSVGLMWAYSVVSILVFGGYVYYAFVKLKQQFLFKKFNTPLLKEIAVYSFFIFLGMIVDKIYWATDQIILSNKTNAASIAVYTIGSSFPSYFIAFSTAVSGVLLPRITKLSTENEKSSNVLSEWFIKVGRLQFWVLSLVLLGFVFIGKEFISIWAGQDYDMSYWIAIIIMSPSIISLTQNTGISILQAKNKIKFRSLVYVVIALINVVISLMLVERYGGIGCAIGTSFGTIIGPIFAMNIYYQKVIELDIIGYWKNILSMLKAWVVPIAFGVVMKQFFPVSGYVSMTIWALIFSVIFIFSAYLVGFNQYEKNLALSWTKKILKK